MSQQTPPSSDHDVDRPKPAVCHVSTVHTTFDTRIFQKECVSLAQAGYPVHLVIQADCDQEVRGVHIHALASPPGRLARLFVWPIKAYRKVRALQPRPAIVHFHDPELMAMGWLLRLRGYQVIYDVHENVATHLLSKPYLPAWLKLPMSLCYRLAEKLLCGGMASVHVLETIAAKYSQPKAVVRNFPQLEAVVPRQPRQAGAPPRLIFLGTVCIDSGALAMIDVAGELKRRGVSFELRIVGPYESSTLQPRMQQLAEQLGVTDWVSLTGPMGYAASRVELAQADVGLCLFRPIPNNINSLPNKILEYMGAGLPVVASDFECWRQYVTDSGGGVQVEATNVEAVADAIQELLADPQRIRKMGDCGQQAVCQQYSWHREKQRLLDFYDMLLRRRADAHRGG